ncbi:hypothetical protein T484DRAFT_1891311 [Baffinella frigidus]|nr:hypothetical protein T484DRAFT_1891311 [Cryptophyta sp. CCMP2293]
MLDSDDESNTRVLGSDESEHSSQDRGNREGSSPGSSWSCFKRLMGPPKIDYDRDAGRLKLHQTEFTEELLRAQGIADCNPVNDPMEPHIYLYESDRPEIPDGEEGA